MKHLPPLFDDARAPAANGLTSFRGLLLLLAIFAATRVVTWTGAYSGSLMNVRIEHSLDPPLEVTRVRRAREFDDPHSALSRSRDVALRDLAPLMRFDAGHYRSIIERGYEYRPVDRSAPPAEREQNIAFFPLYPLLCTPLARLLGPSPAQMLVANGAALLGVVLLYFWAARRTSPQVALFAAAAAVCWPTACFYSFGYAEGLTFALTVLALILADAGRWWPAFVVCAFVTASRPTGAALVPTLLAAYWFNAPRREAACVPDELRSLRNVGARLARLVPFGLVGAAGALAYAGYLTYRFGSPMVYVTNFKVGWVPEAHRPDWLEFLVAARVWDQFKYFGRAIRDFPLGLANLLNPFAWNMLLNFFLLFLSLAGMKRVPRSFRPLLLLGPFIFLQAYVAAGGATFGVEPIGRYMTVAAPAFIVLGAWAVQEWSAGARYALLGALLMLQGVWAFHFGLGEWSG